LKSITYSHLDLVSVIVTMEEDIATILRLKNMNEIDWKLLVQNIGKRTKLRKYFEDAENHTITIAYPRTTEKATSAKDECGFSLESSFVLFR